MLVDNSVREIGRRAVIHLSNVNQYIENKRLIMFLAASGMVRPDVDKRG
jgi:hypothetical protein